MKNFLVVLTLMFAFAISNAQEVIETYKLEYFQKEYKITATEKTFYIDLPSADRDKVSLMFGVDDAESFTKLIDSLKSKYIEWSTLAIKNNINELDKYIKIPILDSRENELYGCAFGYSSWKFDYYVKLKARFKIINGKTLLIIQNVYELKASDNQYMKADGFLLVFSNVNEINNFMKKITKESIIIFYQDKNTKEDVFK